MPNSDNTYGTYNKQTKIIAQNDDGSTALTTFANVNEAKAFIFTDEALTVMDECCTVLEWALQADGDGNNTQLKTTFAFGTKGTVGIAEADDWAAQYNTRKTTLINNKGWTKMVPFAFADNSDHLV